MFNSSVVFGIASLSIHAIGARMAKLGYNILDNTTPGGLMPESDASKRRRLGLKKLKVMDVVLVRCHELTITPSEAADKILESRWVTHVTIAARDPKELVVQYERCTVERARVTIMKQVEAYLRPL
jgi:hypothetical protein